MHGGDPEVREQPQELVLDHVGQGADDHQARLAGRVGGEIGDERCEAGVFALGEGRLDPRARVIEDLGRAGMLDRQPCGGARQVELDDFGGAGADQEQQFYVGAPREQPVDDAVELLVAVRHSGEIALLDDRGAEARFGEHHHPRRGLQQMRAGPRSDDQEERVLDLPVQPDDASEPAEYLALAAFAQHRSRLAAECQRRGRGAHSATAKVWRGALSRRAARSFRRNWPALTA